MLDRTRKRVGHGTEREVGDGRRGIRRRRRNRESSNLLGWHVTEFLTKFFMVAYEW